MMYDQPGLFDQKGCTPYLALLNGSLRSAIPQGQRVALGIVD
jgi:hypothetical protein